MNDVVKMGKCGCVSPAIWLVQGDTRSHILTIRVPRMESGVDLKDLAWKINITNEAGVDDVDVPVMGSVVIDERTIAFDWLIHGVATNVPGKTTFSVVGVDETEDGKPIIWRSSPAMIYIREKHDATPSEEVEAELGELEKMIVYVNGELTNVIAAGEMARSAATHPPIIGENGNWFLWDLEKEIYVDSGMNTRGPKGETPVKGVDYVDGKDGVSPTAEVKETETGATIIVNDEKNGETRVEVKHGKDGYSPVKGVDYFDGKDGYTPVKGKDYTDGLKGDPGFSPSLKVTQTDKGALIEATDENGTTRAIVENGKDGDRGATHFEITVEKYIDEKNGENSYTRSDKTNDEINEALKRGDILILKLNESVLGINASSPKIKPTRYLNFIEKKGTAFLFSCTFEAISENIGDGEDNHIAVIISDNNGAQDINIWSNIFVTRSDIANGVMNPQYLYIKQGNAIWQYNGYTMVTVELPMPTSSLPWSAITDKPFYGGGKIELETEVEFSAEEEGETYIFKEFGLVSGAEYKITFAGKTYTSAAIDISEDGSTIAVGNYSLLFGIGDTGEPFIIANMPRGADMGDKMAYGMVMLVDGNTAAEVMGEKVAIKIESMGAATILNNFSFDSNSIMGNVVPITTLTSPIVAGQKYIVEFNGETYECDVKSDGDGNLYLGSIGIVNNAAYEEPFCIYPRVSGLSAGIYGLIYLATEAKGSGTITVKEKSELKQLDPIYVPTMSETETGGAKVGNGLEVDKNGILSVVLKSPGGKRFKLTVDDNGMITPEEITE